MNHISASNLAIHYQSIGILENNFKDFGPNFRLQPVGVGAGGWDGYGGIKKVQIDEQFLLRWEIKDRLAALAAQNLPGNGPISGPFTVTHTFKRILNSTEEALEFDLASLTETVFSVGLATDDIELVGPDGFIDKPASDFFFPGRYEHTIRFEHGGSDCFDIEETFIYDFEFDRQVF
jgi:hypothetical protein